MGGAFPVRFLFATQPSRNAVYPGRILLGTSDFNPVFTLDDRLKAVAPYLTPDREPGSFYIQKMTTTATDNMTG